MNMQGMTNQGHYGRSTGDAEQRDPKQSPNMTIWGLRSVLAGAMVFDHSKCPMNDA